MKELEMKDRVRQALDRDLTSLHTSPRQREQLIETAMEGRKMKKTKVSAALILALALSLLTVGALAAALLSGQEIVEQVAVPLAKESRQENYTYDELKTLMTTLNENGITLDEGSTLMQAFRAGHGYWEKDTVEEICKAAFGGEQAEWSIEQKHWFGEMMVEIGAWDENIYLLPGDGDMTVPEARALAAKILSDAYGVSLPAESDEQWQIYDGLNLAYDYVELGPTRREEWFFSYVNRKTGNVDYDVNFDRDGGNARPWRARYLEKIDAKRLSDILDQLENRDGTQTKWPGTTWAEFGQLIQGIETEGRAGWLYQHAGYRLPPEGGVSPEKALEIARAEMDYGEITGRLEENVLCCTDGYKPIYKVTHRVIFKAEDVNRGGHYDAVWCLEIDCLTGKVLEKRAYTYGPDGDPMMMYVPFSLLDQAPDPAKASPDAATLQREQELQERVEKAASQYGENMYFWPLEVQQAVYGEPCAVPDQATYDRALEIARQALADQYGADALEKLGDYQTGLMARFFDDEEENGCGQWDWDFMFTTDPEFLSDGYRVQFIQLIYKDTETIRDLIVDHASMGNG